MTGERSSIGSADDAAERAQNAEQAAYHLAKAALIYRELEALYAGRRFSEIAKRRAYARLHEDEGDRLLARSEGIEVRTDAQRGAHAAGQHLHPCRCGSRHSTLLWGTATPMDFFVRCEECHAQTNRFPDPETAKVQWEGMQSSGANAI